MEAMLTAVESLVETSGSGLTFDEGRGASTVLAEPAVTGLSRDGGDIVLAGRDTGEARGLEEKGRS